VHALRDGVVEAARLLGDEGVPVALRWACAEIADARGLSWGRRGPRDFVAALAAWREPGAEQHLGAVHESLLSGRKVSGAFYTPYSLVAHVLDEALTPLLRPDARVRVLDPACGTGAFLVPAARRIADVTGLPIADAVRCVHGVDLDGLAVEIARFLLWLEAPSVSKAELASRVVAGDGLLLEPDPPYDVVVGNPPFLNQLRSATTRASRIDGVGPYTDTSAVFLLRSARLVREGGRVGLVQPLSVLAARDAAPVREALDRDGSIVSLCASDRPVFPGTPVLTCAPVWERGRSGGMGAGEWSVLAAPSFGIPPVALSESHGVLGDLGPCTADFRDQFYGLVPFVRDAPSGVVGPDEAALVTTGLIEPAECRWGRTPTRFAKQRYAAPVVDLAALRAEGSLAAWAASRLVPKVLVATQGAVLEGVVDITGEWLPSVPTLVCTPPPERLWHVLAVLLAPPVVAHAAARYVGAGLTARAVKLSAKQLAGLPLPGDREAWDRGAELARLAQSAATPDDRASQLLRCAEVMSSAYDVGDTQVIEWWSARAGLRSGSAR
jgi:SAM-dependent methyltransferase